MSTQIKYAYKRHNTWVYRRTYPQHLQPLLGSSLKQSVKTADAKTAKARVAELNQTFTNIVKEADAHVSANTGKASANSTDHSVRVPVARPRYHHARLVGERLVKDLAKAYLTYESERLRPGSYKAIRFATELLISHLGTTKADRHPMSDEQVEELKAVFEDDPVTNTLFVVLRDTGARVAEIAGLRFTDCNLDEGYINITPTPWRRLRNAPSERSVPLSPEAVKVLQALINDKDPEAPVFERYARPRGMDRVSAMMMNRFRKVITDKKLSMHSLRHRMKDKLRNTGCPEAVSMAILGHGTNTVAANYGSGYAIEVMREHMERAWSQ